SGSLGGLGLGHTLLEFIDASGRIDEFLLAGIEGMAHVANADNDHWLGGAGLDHVAAGATDFGFLIFGMDIGSHKRRENVTAKSVLTRANFARDQSRKDCSPQLRSLCQMAVAVPPVPRCFWIALPCRRVLLPGGAAEALGARGRVPP